MASCILIFGGTFDPPHRAHVELPQMVAAKLNCARIVYVPTSANPLKDETPTSTDHRLAMLTLALRGRENCEINEIELKKPPPAYTVDTLESLWKQFGSQVELRLLVGADAAVGFHRWKEPARLLQLATPAVILRPNFGREEFRRAMSVHWSAEDVARWMEWTIDVPQFDIQATDLRQRLARGEDVSDKIPPAVLSYMREHNLYRNTPPTE